MDSPPEPSLPAIVPSATASAKLFTPTSTAGTKRPAPSLLPPFEPLSSSPGLPRPLKRQNTGNGYTGFGDARSGANAGANGNGGAHLKYPTPVPTSSTGILSSSPPRGLAPATMFHSRDAAPPQQRSQPSLVQTSSERAPLSAVPSLELPENGDVVVMGRSSNSSHYQLSANRLVSRVHVKARYIPAQAEAGVCKMEIICNGWNGLKLHCQGRTWELFKGDSFTSETEGTDIMMDVQDARLMIQWPKRGIDSLGLLSDSSWDDSPRSQTRGRSLMPSSPLRRAARIESPESPTLAHMSSSQRLQALLPEEHDESIQIFEDEPELPEPKRDAVDVNVSMRTEATESFSSELSDPEEKDPDEENDPIVHSFGPFGANIEGRMASISTKSPKALKPPRRSHHVSSTETLTPRDVNYMPEPKREPESESSLSPPPKEESPSPSIEIDPAICNHVINQLAFSRLSSTPLPAIMQNLPAESRHGLEIEVLRMAIEATPAIGIIERQGKDAAGKALESEYYYVPDKDDDEGRRAAVVDGLRKPSLRNCRKQHKV